MTALWDDATPTLSISGFASTFLPRRLRINLSKGVAEEELRGQRLGTRSVTEVIPSLPILPISATIKPHLQIGAFGRHTHLSQPGPNYCSWDAGSGRRRSSLVERLGVHKGRKARNIPTFRYHRISVVITGAALGGLHFGLGGERERKRGICKVRDLPSLTIPRQPLSITYIPYLLE